MHVFILFCRKVRWILLVRGFKYIFKINNKTQKDMKPRRKFVKKKSPLYVIRHNVFYAKLLLPKIQNLQNKKQTWALCFSKQRQLIKYVFTPYRITKRLKKPESMKTGKYRFTLLVFIIVLTLDSCFTKECVQRVKLFFWLVG